MTTHGSVELAEGNIKVPTLRTREWADHSELLESLVDSLARKHERNLQFGNKEVDRLVSQLACGRNVEEVNRILQGARPWGKVGSGHDYDFTLCGLTLILYRFHEEREILFPETVDHIVDTLLTAKGGVPAAHPVIDRAPFLKFLPLKDTENHILMTEGSRFLTNKWMIQNREPDPIYDNARNGLEQWLLQHLAGMEKAGIHEYNSIPYEGYTLRALLNLASFAEGAVGDSASRILDRMTWNYALGSLSLRRFAPFRRSPDRAHETRLDGHYQTTMMKAWMSLGGVKNLEIGNVPQHAMWVLLTPYRPADAVFDWVMSKPSDYFIQVGHGSDGSPEIYSGGPGYLITAGGVANATLRDNVARPTTLMLDDGAQDLKQLVHVNGPGRSFRQWNNTGVHRRFAVSAGPVWVPEDWEPSIERGRWSFYERSGMRIAVYSSPKLGLFCLLPEEGDLNNAAGRLMAANASSSDLETLFRWPGGPVLSYDVSANKNEWVISSVDGKATDRSHGKWPLMKGILSGNPIP